MHVGREVQPASLPRTVCSRTMMPIETRQIFAVGTGVTRSLTHVRPAHLDLFCTKARVLEATWTERALASQKVAFAISLAGQ